MGNSHLLQLSNHHICSKLLLSSEKGIPLEVLHRDAQEKISETTLSLKRRMRIIRITQKVSDHPAQ
jgi:hypothetical protein